MANFQVFLMAAAGILFYQEKLTMRFTIALPVAVVGLFLMANLVVISFISAFFLAGQAIYQGDSLIIPDLMSWSALIAYGLFSQMIGWVLISISLPHTRASIAGLILLLQPSLAYVWDI